MFDAPDAVARVRNEARQCLLENTCLLASKELRVEWLEAETPIARLKSWLSSSGAGIEKLPVDAIEARDVAQCLKYMPSLRVLHIDNSSTMSGRRHLFESQELRTLVQALAVGLASRVCSTFEHIRFEECGNPFLYSKGLTTMICSHWDRSIIGDERCLKSVIFGDPNRGWSFPYSHLLRQFCREGLFPPGTSYREMMNSE